MKPLTIIHTECSTGWGGQEIRVFTEMKAMQSRGHRLLLAAPERAEIFRRCQQAGYTVFAFRDTKSSYPASIYRLTQWFKTIRPQVLNLHSSRDGWIGGIAGRLAGVPLILRSRHIEVAYPHRFMSRIAFAHLPHHVLTTSEKISKGLIDALGLDKERVTCIPTGIDLDTYSKTSPGTLRKELNLATDIPLIGMISVLRGWKGHIHLFEALKILRDRAHPIHLIVAGDGPQKETLPKWTKEKGIADFVHFLGHRSDVPNLLNSLDALIVPSEDHEGIPQIVLQAQATGTPVIGSSVGGIPEVITHRETGLLVPPRDPDALAQTLEELLHSPALREQLSTRGAEYARQHHSTEVMCQKLESIYEKNPAGNTNPKK